MNILIRIKVDIFYSGVSFISETKFVTFLIGLFIRYTLGRFAVLFLGITQVLEYSIHRCISYYGSVVIIM